MTRGFWRRAGSCIVSGMRCPTHTHLLLLLALLCGGGCAFGPAAVKPRGSSAIVLDTEEKSTAVEVKYEYLVKVTLPPIDPGLVWQIAFHDPRYLKQMHEIRPGEGPGAGATVTFLAISMGRSRLHFLLLPRAGAREADPIDRRELVLTIR